MRKSILYLLIFFTASLNAQKKEPVNIPPYVNYKYCKPKVHEAAKELALNELVLNNPTYSLATNNFIIGPVLWSRLDSLDGISEIEGGKVTFHVDKKKFDGKYIQTPADGKLVWDQLRSECDGVPIRVRKLTFAELEYYWAVISFDIVEPLLCVETSEHKYILDLDPKTLHMNWLDEVPKDIKSFLKGLL